MDEITLTLPRDRSFHGIANLVLGGLATRLSVTIESLEDLQTGMESLLARDEDAGQVTVSVRVRPDALETSIGPFGARVRDELAGDGEDRVGLRRILETVMDRVEVGEREGGHWVHLTKMLSERKEPKG